MTYQIVMPRVMEIGGGASGSLASVLERLGLSRPLIVTDAFMNTRGPVPGLVTQLREAGITAGVFADTVPDPTTASIDAGVEALRQDRYDCVIGVGGGSPLDSAKAIAYLGTFGGTMRDYKAPRQNDGPALPVIAVPTTAGTGSEVTRFTVITDSESGEKMLCGGTAFCPTAALVDFELTLSMPFRLTADTGLDTLTHCIEAYVSRRRNPISDAHAIAGMRAVADNLRTACFEPDNREAREAMMRAATQGGMAFSNASVALVHGMSRPLGAFFHVPHGLSNAMLLPRITEYSAEGEALPRYADCARAMAVTAPDADDETAVAALLDALRALNRDLQVPTPADYGIDRAEYEGVLETMAEQALASGSPGNNPRVPDVPTLKQLYMDCYE
ncbi:Alcohol dehydrogenase 2 [wastewater metagenome]|uniref:Alcohol dehydrogenase 2 n=2 Tax=unclassified sequences TaxID=12908 RepID=A0A5B8R9C8_9ZZZZ|nr:iron-containing alcohol dehydrogenase [Arhodomonas aquaeolei]MCS4504397.1 iron-containing alcohol dehydrogenase [Arhodomonas aquaeolei]QEA04568.1 alcohol dehydrogenase 2 [uncultured organism]